MSLQVQSRADRRPSVFVSYSRHDSAFARRLCEALEAECHVYIDEESIAAAEKWRDELARGIDGADSFLFVITPSSVASAECNQELSRAQVNRKRIIPLLLAPAEGIPAALAERQFIRFDGDADFDETLARLRETITTDIGWVREHTRLVQRATAWEQREQDRGYLLRGAELRDAEAWLARSAEIAEPAPTPAQLRLLNASRQAVARTRARIGVVAVVGLLLAGVAFWQYRVGEEAAARELDQRLLAYVADSYQRLRRDPLQAVDLAQRATAIRPAPEALTALADSREVAVRRRENRAEEAQLLGRGAGYMMSRWREGKLFCKFSRDGRHALVATERGKDGADPPGNVYLVNLDSLRATELLPGKKAKNRRLEFPGFSLSGEEIFVSRQFYLDIYDLDGQRTKSVQLEYHAKPVHLIAGMFGRYVLAADTTGNVMMADTESGDRPQLDYNSRRDGAALFVEAAPSGRHAVLVFEQGGADLLDLDDPRNVTQTRLPVADVVFAVFDADESRRRLLTTTGVGGVHLWRYGDGAPERLCEFKHGDTPVRLASFSTDGNRIVTLGDDGSVAIWDIEAGALVERL